MAFFVFFSLWSRSLHPAKSIKIGIFEGIEGLAPSKKREELAKRRENERTEKQGKGVNLITGRFSCFLNLIFGASKYMIDDRHIIYIAIETAIYIAILKFLRKARNPSFCSAKKVISWTKRF